MHWPFGTSCISFIGTRETLLIFKQTYDGPALRSDTPRQTPPADRREMLI